MKRERDAKTGQKMINQYLILQEIGRGVHGKVKLAFDTELNDFVAIKVVRKKQAKGLKLGTALAGGGTTDKIKKEIAIMKKCIHPHVVRLFEVIDDPKAEKIYMVLEYLDGGDLPWQEGHQSSVVPVEVMKSIFRDLILGVEYRKYYLYHDFPLIFII